MAVMIQINYEADNQGTDCPRCDALAAPVEANLYSDGDVASTCLRCAVAAIKEDPDMLIEVGNLPGRESYTAGVMVARLWLDAGPSYSDVLRSISANERYMGAQSNIAKAEFARGLLTELREYLADRSDV